MAITHRKGNYKDFDPTRLQPGEWAVVQQDDPSATDGRAAYLCYAVGVVKRIANYEDMQDWFAEIKASTIDSVVHDAMEDIRIAYGRIEEETLDAELERAGAEKLRDTAEDERISAETARKEAETAREEEEVKRRALAKDLADKVAANFFDGATFTPVIEESDNECILMWENDKGKPNPPSVNIKGPKGNDGVVTMLDAGMYCFVVQNGHLYLVHGEDAEVPEMEIRDGHLFVKIGE